MPTSYAFSAMQNFARLRNRATKYALCMLLFFGVVENSYAMICTDNNESFSTKTEIGTIYGIANDTQPGTIVWRSSPITTSIKCWADVAPGDEYAYIYLNPEHPSNDGLGPDVEVGINFDGYDHICSRIPDKGPAGHCRIRTTLYVPQCLKGNCTSQAVKKTFTYSILLIKKSPPIADTDRMLVGFDNYVAARFDGIHGINPRSDSFSITVHGLNKLKYLGCPVTARASTTAIHFTTVSTSNAKANTVADSKYFNVITEKTCNSVFSLNIILKPSPESSANVDQNLLIPVLTKPNGNIVHNTTVGIELKKDGIRLPLNVEFPLIYKRKETYLEQKIDANLIWLTDKPQAGTFHGGLIMEFFHR